MTMTPARTADLCAFYGDQLLDNVVPFWLTHAPDPEHGGFATCLDRDGTVYEWAKICMWQSGRMIWAFAHLYNEVEKRAAWLDAAVQGLRFATDCGFAEDGRMYYSLSREGMPLQGPQDIYTELFHVLGMNEVARATGDETLGQAAWDLFERVWELLRQPGRAHQPLLAGRVPVRMYGHALIPLNVLDSLRTWRPRRGMSAMIDACVELILRTHWDVSRQGAMEYVLWDGSPAPAHWGRRCCPGHMIEAGIFIVHEAAYRDDRTLADDGCRLIRRGFELGWDGTFGGLFNDIDIEGRPIPADWNYLADRKLWWQHAEGLYGALLAYAVTGDDWFRCRFEEIHDYSFANFADPDLGEWFAVLDRTGRRLDDSKGNARKSLFHLGRNLLYCWRLLRTMEDGGATGEGSGMSWGSWEYVRRACATPGKAGAAHV